MKRLIAMKTRFGNYQTFTKEFNNEKHFNNWFDYMTSRGHKIVGIHEYNGL